jgi:hypothetical protein
MALGRKRTCRSCSAELFFGLNVKSGRPVPLEPTLRLVRIWVPVQEEKTRDADEVLVELKTFRGYVGHHFTCPEADKHRRGG